MNVVSRTVEKIGLLGCGLLSEGGAEEAVVGSPGAPGHGSLREEAVRAGEDCEWSRHQRVLRGTPGCHGQCCRYCRRMGHRRRSAFRLRYSPKLPFCPFCCVQFLLHLYYILAHSIAVYTLLCTCLLPQGVGREYLAWLEGLK